MVVKELLLIAWQYKLSQADKAEKVLKAFFYFISMTSPDSLVFSALEYGLCKDRHNSSVSTRTH